MDMLIASLVLAAIPLVMLFWFKANSGVMFFAACAGLVLISNLDSTVVTTAAAFVPGEGEAYVRLSVVLLSIVFAGLVFNGAESKVNKALDVIVALVLGMMLTLILPAATNLSWLVNGSQNEIWRDVNEFRSLVIASGFGLSLVSVLMTKKKYHRKHKR